MRIIIHIGLPKTATTYLQAMIFSSLNTSKNIIYNPPEIMSHLVYTFNIQDNKELFQKNYTSLKENIKNILQNYEKEKDLFFISCEALSMNFKDFNMTHNCALIKDLFPDAEIIICLRHQPDWIISIYKHLLQSAKTNLNIQKFIYQKHEIQNNFDIKLIDYEKLIETYATHFGKNKINVIFYETFKENPQLFINSFLKLLNQTNFSFQYKDYFLNRSFSAFMIYVSLFFNNIFKINKRLSKKYLVEWRKIVQGVLDKIFYWDWDLLKKNNLREKLNAYYLKQNLNIKLKYNLKDMPSIYTNN